MESLLLKETFSRQRLYLSLPQSHSLSHLETALIYRRIKCTGKNSSSDNERTLYTTNSSSVSFSKINKNTASRAVLQPDYAVAVAKTSVVEEPVTKAETGEGNGIGISQYLQGKTYFITGATGFLAKGKTTYI